MLHRCNAHTPSAGRCPISAGYTNEPTAPTPGLLITLMNCRRRRRCCCPHKNRNQHIHTHTQTARRSHSRQANGHAQFLSKGKNRWAQYATRSTTTTASREVVEQRAKQRAGKGEWANARALLLLSLAACPAAKIVITVCMTSALLMQVEWVRKQIGFAHTPIGCELCTVLVLQTKRINA